MRGRTHVATGMAASLLITNPSTVPGVIAALTGGAIGGWIVDLDVKSTDIDRETVLDSIIVGLVFVGFFALDYLVGNGACEYFLSHLGLTTIIWGIALVAVINTFYQFCSDNLSCPFFLASLLSVLHSTPR